MPFNFASDERIAFCFKLWVKELMEESNPNAWQITVINYAMNEIFDGDYCSNEEFDDKDRIVNELQNLITKSQEKN